MEELFDVVDEQNNLLGVTKERKQVHQDGDWHRVVQIYVVNKDGHFLVHKRSPQKDLSPNKWDARFGGHLTAGELVQEGALRELEDEIGIQARTDKLVELFTEPTDFNGHRQIITIYCYPYNNEPLAFNDGEVVDTKWLSKEEIINGFTNHSEEWAGRAHAFERVYNSYCAIEKELLFVS